MGGTVGLCHCKNHKEYFSWPQNIFLSHILRFEICTWQRMKQLPGNRKRKILYVMKCLTSGHAELLRYSNSDSHAILSVRVISGAGPENSIQKWYCMEPLGSCNHALRVACATKRERPKGIYFTSDRTPEILLSLQSPFQIQRDNHSNNNKKYLLARNVVMCKRNKKPKACFHIWWSAWIPPPEPSPSSDSLSVCSQGHMNSFILFTNLGGSGSRI